jgi:hypothetical protein
MLIIAVVALRTTIVGLVLGSLVVQGALVLLLWMSFPGPDPSTVATLVVLLLGVVAFQVIGACVWRLLSMVRDGTVFSRRALGYVDGVVAAIATGAGLVLALAVTGALANRTTDGDVVAPGMVGLACGLALLAAGVALVVAVQRMLLAQAVDRDEERRALRAELDSVI